MLGVPLAFLLFAADTEPALFPVVTVPSVTVPAVAPAVETAPHVAALPPAPLPAFLADSGWYCIGRATPYARDGSGAESTVNFDFHLRIAGVPDSRFVVSPAFVGFWGITEAGVRTVPRLARFIARQRLAAQDTLLWTPEGVRICGTRLGEKRIDFPEPWLLWPNAPAPGDTWGARYEYMRHGEMETAVALFSVEGHETISIPAGDFSSARVAIDIRCLRPDGEYSRGIVWLAPGLGPVRQEYELGEGDRIRFRVEWSMVLR